MTYVYNPESLDKNPHLRSSVCDSLGCVPVEPETEAKPLVHNHGPDEGDGLSCPERILPGGGRRGWCLDEADYRATPHLDALMGDDTTFVTSETGGVKGQKLARYDLIPAEALEEVANVYGMGARKYEDHNWRRGHKWSLSFAALMRHAWKFWRGETYDEESGLHHMAHAVFHALALINNTTEHPDYDDRWIR